MFKLSFLTGLALTLGLSTARQCQNITVPVTITGRNAKFSIATPQTNIEVTNFILDLTQQGANYTQQIFQEFNDVSGSYELAMTYCTPDKGPGKTLQILTHGIGFDRSYWDLPFNNFDYSYAETAVDQYGFSTLTWDRLGIGMSSHGEPVNEIQAPLEVAALTALTKMARAGSLPGITDTYSKYVHVGHSFGSEQSFALSRNDPSPTDGVVLTGYSRNGTFIPYFALGGNFVLAPTITDQYTNGYLAASDASAVQTNFFAPGMFDPNILTFATTTGQPVTLGELLTIGQTSYGTNAFSGPVLVITGNRDVPYCGGNCLATGDPSLSSIPAGVKQFIPNAQPFETFIVEGAGHGLNMEYSHDTTFQHIQQFLVTSGLGA
jgi:pimeloyl-ACP methyl ester carboxylesterase